MIVPVVVVLFLPSVGSLFWVLLVLVCVRVYILVLLVAVAFVLASLVKAGSVVVIVALVILLIIPIILATSWLVLEVEVYLSIVVSDKGYGLAL